MNVLATGGAGYIGSHTIIELLEDGHEIVIIDSLVNSSEEPLRRVQRLTGKKVKFYKLDLADSSVESVFNSHNIDAVIHFAGLKAVGESTTNALRYYQNNLVSTLNLLNIMRNYEVRNLIFSSSATIYGDPKSLPIREDAPKKPTNPYGQTKLMIEQILEDTVKTNEDWCVTSLRYFNPIGAHSSGELGDDPAGLPNNLFPYIAQVAGGRLKNLKVFGGDYETPDGTGVRDYIHVVDLAKAHLAALRHIHHPNDYKAYNIGTGKGNSVLELIKQFRKVSKKKIPYTVTARRSGDIACYYADPSLARHELKWQARLSIEDACRSNWKWQVNNPNGFL